MKSLALALSLFLTSGCIATTEMIQDGHDYIQLTQSRNVWGHNVVSEHRCKATDRVEGFCPSRQHVQTGLFQGPGVALASATLNAAAIAGGAAILMHGLQTQRVSPPSTMNQGPFYASTLNAPAGAIPGLKFVGN